MAFLTLNGLEGANYEVKPFFINTDNIICIKEGKNLFKNEPTCFIICTGGEKYHVMHDCYEVARCINNGETRPN